MRVMPEVMWTYLGRPDYETQRAKGCFVDGDTIICERLIGQPRIKEGELWLRLLEVDTPEVTGSTKAAGLAAAAFTQAWVEDAEMNAADPQWPLILHTIRRDSFGRWLSYVYRRDTGEALHEALIAANHSVRVSALVQMGQA